VVVSTTAALSGTLAVTKPHDVFRIAKQKAIRGETSLASYHQPPLSWVRRPFPDQIRGTVAVRKKSMREDRNVNHAFRDALSVVEGAKSKREETFKIMARWMKKSV